jgi:hypothetical protein
LLLELQELQEELQMDIPFDFNVSRKEGDLGGTPPLWGSGGARGRRN